MELKEIYTQQEADFMSLISGHLCSNPDSFQGYSAYWGENVEVNFKDKILSVDPYRVSDLSYYCLAGMAMLHGYEFEEVLK